MIDNKNQEENKLVLNLTDELKKDMRTLNNLFFFDKDESFISDFQSNALIISQTTDKKIKKQIDQIEQKINEINAALTSETQIDPLNQDGINKNMVDIMSEYSYIGASITLRGESKGSRDYTIGLNRIQSALKNLAHAIDRYNETAVSRKWPMIQSLHESQSMAKQQRDSAMSELLAYLEQKHD